MRLLLDEDLEEPGRSGGVLSVLVDGPVVIGFRFARFASAEAAWIGTPHVFCFPGGGGNGVPGGGSGWPRPMGSVWDFVTGSVSVSGSPS